MLRLKKLARFYCLLIFSRLSYLRGCAKEGGVGNPFGRTWSIFILLWLHEQWRVCTSIFSECSSKTLPTFDWVKFTRRKMHAAFHFQSCVISYIPHTSLGHRYSLSIFPCSNFSALFLWARSGLCWVITVRADNYVTNGSFPLIFEVAFTTSFFDRCLRRRETLAAYIWSFCHFVSWSIACREGAMRSVLVEQSKSTAKVSSLLTAQ